MRAATRPHHSTAAVETLPVGAARQALIRLAIACLCTLALLLVWRPAVVHAQATSPSTAKPASQPAAKPAHIVRTGESLWSIALRYYGDGAAWQELARVNGVSTSTATARPLLVGMRLTVPATPPARAKDAPPAATKPAADVPKVALAEAVVRPAAPRAGGSSLASQTAGKSDAAPVAPRSTKARATATKSPAVATRRAAPKTPSTAGAAVANTAAVADTSASSMNRSAPLRPMVKQEIPIARGLVRVGLVEPGGARAARGNDVPTIFIRRIPTLEEAEASMRAAARPSAVAPRRGEFDAAPFLVSAAQLAKAGRIVRRVGAAGGAGDEKGQRMLIADEVEIVAPAGVSLAVGDRVLALNDRGALEGGLRVEVPGGVLQVTQADAGKPVIAVVRSQSGLLEQGQRLVPVVGGPAMSVATSVSPSDTKTSVLWVDQEALLPTLQSYVLLGAGLPQGVRAGDQFALVRTRGSANTGEEERIAIVRVVRSDASGSTAIVIKQDRPEIVTGAVARRVARVP